MKKLNVLISTFFGFGYVSKLSGTVTSFVTTILLYITFEILNHTNLQIIIISYLVLFTYSFYAVYDAATEFKNKDPKQIVLDEVLGQTLPLIFLLYLIQNNQIIIQIEIYYLLSFIFFRLFDIVKPFPVSYFDNNFKNSFGIIMDDIMAGLYAIVLIYLISIKF